MKIILTVWFVLFVVCALEAYICTKYDDEL